MFRNVWNLLRTAPFRLLAVAVLAHSMSGQSPERIRVIDVSPQADRVSGANAAEAYNQGNIIRMVGASEADAIRLFGNKLGNFKVSGRSRGVALPNAGSGKPLKLQAVAGYKDANGVVHTVQSFGEDRVDAKIETKWREHLDDWVEREIAKAPLAKEGDPPSSGAWTPLYSTTVQATSNYGNFTQNTIAVYRLNAIDPAKDHYMVLTTPEVKPEFSAGCDGFAGCGWHTISRHFSTKAAEAVGLPDHGPTGTITTEMAGFTIGLMLNPTGPTGQVSYSTSWSQPSVTTVDASTSTYGAWDETFNQRGAQCLPLNGDVTGVSKGTFFSQQGAIFQVPGGTTKFTPSIESEATFCSYAIVSVFDATDSLSLNASLPLGPPTFSVSPTSLTIPAGQSATLLVNASIPGSTQGFVWDVTTNHPTSWLTVPSKGPFSTGRAIQVSVAPNTPDGSTGTISIDSSQPFAAPSVETGPLEVQVTVGTPKTQNSAGVLLMGGTNQSSIVTTPEVFDVATQQVVPTTGLPIFAPEAHTATLLRNGDVLIAGGTLKGLQNHSSITNAAQLFHPATRTFSPTGNMKSERAAHTATLLPNGKVLVIGGTDSHGSSLATAELYDPVTGTFTPTGSMGTPHAGHTASLLPTTQPGQPAYVAVYGFGTKEQMELWSEVSGTFTAQSNDIGALRSFPQPLPISDVLLVAGGFAADIGKSVASVMSLTRSTVVLPGTSMNVPRSNHTLTALPTPGDMVAIGGSNIVLNPLSITTLGSAEVLAAGAWTLQSGTNPCPAKGCLITPRSSHTATLLPDGTIFVAGGLDSNSNVLGSTEIYNPTTKSFSPGPIMLPRTAHTATPFVTSTTTFNVGPNPSIAGQAVTMSASVTAITGTPAGSVQFMDGSTVLQTVPLKDGQATFSTSALAAGTHSLTAVYSGNGIPAASQSLPITLTVRNAETTVSVSSSPNPSRIGEEVTFIATVRPTPNGGSVTFKDGTVTLGTSPVTNDSAKFTTSSLSLGQHSITAVFSGSATTSGGTSPPFTQTVGARTTNTKLQISPDKAVFGQAVTFMASVTSSPQGTPGGNVTFRSGANTLGTAPLVNGLAKLSTSTLAAGTYSVTATYGGDANYGPSSDSDSLTIQKAPTQITLSSSLNPSQSGQAVTFTATVSGSSSGVPTGTVTFLDGATVLGTPALSGGVAALSLSTLASGNHSIRATYNGDANFTAVTSAVLVQQVGGGLVTPTVVLTAQPDSVTVGHAVNFTVRVSYPGGPTPTGSVTISDATNAAKIYGIGPLNNGVANLTNTTIPVGSYNLVATYGGDGGVHYNGAQSNSVSIQVVAGKSKEK